jgi:peptidoglycan/xylan/chitin deacetylase (PgdA/CDA1 family)
MIIEHKKRPIPILMYHSISSFAYPPFRPYIVWPTKFSEQMAYLAQCGYNTITVSQYAHVMAHAGEGLPANPILLTFDDAYTDFYTHALPILQKYGFVATLYVPTGFVGGTSLWLAQMGEGKRAILSWSLLAEISNCGIECGAHTHSHPYLNMLPLAVARNEIVRSRDLLDHQFCLSLRLLQCAGSRHRA